MRTLIDYANSFLGLPYIWGGDDTVLGFDCSGLAQEILASVGMDPPGDQTAHGLYKHFLSNGLVDYRDAGALAFYGTHERITHIAFMIDEARVIEAGGGGSRTKTPADAAKHNAFCRIRPLSARRDLVQTIYPDYPAYVKDFT